MGLYPRQVSVLGAENLISCVGILSKLNTCGVLVLGRAGGASPNSGSATGPNETYIYLNGLTPMAGGVTEVMTNPAGGVALGAAVTAGIFDASRQRGFTLLGSDRVSSSVKICGSANTARPVPALGIMYNAGAAIMYIYMGTGGFLCYGDETAWQAASPTNKMAVGAIPTSGSRGNRVDGRTIIGNDDGINCGAMVIASAGKSGALGLLSGDHQVAAMLYIDATPKPVFANAATWLAYAAS